MPDAAQRVFVIVPAYNEAAVIRDTVTPLLGKGYEIVVVDDGSADDTAKALEGLPVHYLRHAVNLGQGAALQTGMSYALGRGADYVVHFDADGQHDAHDIEKLLEPLRAGTADVVIGSRFLRPEDSARVPALRRALLRTAVLVNGVLTGMWLTDAHHGLRALGRAALERIHLVENRMAHATEILAQIRRHHLRLVEIPAPVTYTDYSRAKGQSSMNAINIVIDVVLNRLL